MIFVKLGLFDGIELKMMFKKLRVFVMNILYVGIVKDVFLRNVSIVLNIFGILLELIDLIVVFRKFSEVRVFCGFDGGVGK